MAERRDYYFRQKVTEAELDAGFEGLEQADFDFCTDHGLVGIVAGLGVAEASVPDLTVDVQGPGAAYSKAGERIQFSSTQNVDMSVDDGALSTAVAAPGNARIVSLFLTFDRLLSDPRIDGNSLTVFFVRGESFAFSVVAGAEATSGTEVPPALDSGKILVGDITLIFGQTTILNADIDADGTRREAAFVITDGATTIRSGTAEAAIQALATTFSLDDVVHKSGAETIAGVKSFTDVMQLAAAGAFVDATALSNAGIPDPVIRDIIRAPAGTGATLELVKISEFLSDKSAAAIIARTRIFATADGGIILSFNCDFNNTTKLWVADALLDAYTLRMGGGASVSGDGQFSMKRRAVAAAAETWTDLAWTTTHFTLARIDSAGSFFTGATGLLEDGRLFFGNSASVNGTNPAKTDSPGANMLYGRNVPKVYGRIQVNAGVITLEDGFGISAVAAATNDFTITFDTNFANTDYVISSSAQHDGSAWLTHVVAQNRAVGILTCRIRRSSDGNQVNIGSISEFYDVTIFGQQ